MLQRIFRPKFIFFLILLVAILFRFYDLNWDQGDHLHPDERFLTMVGVDMRLPQSFGDYIDPTVSTFNPANIKYPFYVYGIFPVVANKLLAMGFGEDNYGDFTLQGRMLSAFADLMVVILIFKTIELLEKRHKLHPHIKYWGALFYAVAVLPIQLAHFFAVDTFLNTFVFASFYCALRLSITKHRRWLLLSGLFFGLAIGSKVTAIFIIPLLIYCILLTYVNHHLHLKKHWLSLLGDFLVFGITSYIMGRLADPYIFQSSNFFDPSPSKLLLQNLKELAAWSNPQALYPPGVQWIHKLPVIFAFQNLAAFGIGIGFTLFVFVGSYYIIRRYRTNELFIFFLWVCLFFIYQSVQVTKTMRYFLMLYPFLAIFAGLGFTLLLKHSNKYIKTVAFLFVLIWPLLFFSIYTKPHSRVTASKWIDAVIPTNSVLLTESWDDALPLPVTPPAPSMYTIDELPVFDPDSPEKWQKMDAMLAKGDYLILSSNRGWGSIPTVPERYPQMTQFYKNLFAGKTDYKEVAEFTSYPSLSYLGIPITIPDDGAEEAFTVYDHPKVMIFKHIR
jgi:hypothetical protein